jgi:hypothetical protein
MLYFSYCESFCGKYKGKGKIILLQAMNAYRGRRFIVPLILKLDLRWTEVFSFHHSGFTPGESARSLLNDQERLDMYVTLYINPLSTKLYLSDLKTHFLPRSKHSLLRF